MTSKATWRETIYGTFLCLVVLMATGYLFGTSFVMIVMLLGLLPSKVNPWRKLGEWSRKLY